MLKQRNDLHEKEVRVTRAPILLSASFFRQMHVEANKFTVASTKYQL